MRAVNHNPTSASVEGSHCVDAGTVVSPQIAGFEPFVDADVVANFLSLARRQVLEWARTGEIPAHPLGRGKRRTWRFRLSEVAGAVLSHKLSVAGYNSVRQRRTCTPEK
jgi:hypothetical protein